MVTRPESADGDLAPLLLMLVVGLLIVALGVLRARRQAPIRARSLELYRVAFVADGDTIHIHFRGGIEKVRLLGIDAPEMHHPSKPSEPYGPVAKGELERLLHGHRVGVETDPEQPERDRHGRLLAYVWREDGLLLNRELLALGAAIEYVPTTGTGRRYRYRGEFKGAEREARRARRGLHAKRWKG